MKTKTAYHGQVFSGKRVLEFWAFTAISLERLKKSTEDLYRGCTKVSICPCPNMTESDVEKANAKMIDG